jgi:hypothetical protein
MSLHSICQGCDAARQNAVKLEGAVTILRERINLLEKMLLDGGVPSMVLELEGKIKSLVSNLSEFEAISTTSDRNKEDIINIKNFLGWRFTKYIERLEADNDG